MIATGNAVGRKTLFLMPATQGMSMAAWVAVTNWTANITQPLPENIFTLSEFGIYEQRQPEARFTLECVANREPPGYSPVERAVLELVRPESPIMAQYPGGAYPELPTLTSQERLAIAVLRGDRQAALVLADLVQEEYLR